MTFSGWVVAEAELQRKLALVPFAKAVSRPEDGGGPPAALRTPANQTLIASDPSLRWAGPAVAGRL